MIPMIKNPSDNFLSFFLLGSGGIKSVIFSGKNHFATTSVSPASASNTMTLNPMSSQPQSGIEDKKDIGFWIVEIGIFAFAGCFLLLLRFLANK
jgi:hypothetical protein